MVDDDKIVYVVMIAVALMIGEEQEMLDLVANEALADYVLFDVELELNGYVVVQRVDFVVLMVYIVNNVLDCYLFVEELVVIVMDEAYLDVDEAYFVNGLVVEVVVAVNIETVVVVDVEVVLDNMKDMDDMDM